MKEDKKADFPNNFWNDIRIILIIIGLIILLFVLQESIRPRGCGTCNAKSRTDDANIRAINKQIEIYRENTGYWPDFPNMESLLLSDTYFPDGPLTDPFTNENKLGVYSLDMRGKIPHVYSEPHTTATGMHQSYVAQPNAREK